jgi:hypothetical protein
MRIRSLVALAAAAIIIPFGTAGASALATAQHPKTPAPPEPTATVTPYDYQTSPTASGDRSPAIDIAKLTGPDSINHTDTKWKITGTDLGITWDNGSGQTLTAFGDTFGDWEGPGGGGGDWRSNTLVRSTDHDLSNGMTFDSAVEDKPGHAGELIASKKIDGVEITTIPTAGISVGNRQYLAYMSVKHWGPPGLWDTNFQSIAYSDDNGATWSTADSPVWTNNAGGTDPFQMGAFAKRDGYVYFFGTPNGRMGTAHVSRVPQDSVLDKAAYRYWNGSDWVADETAATTIVDAHVAELSVQYNDYTHRWLMTYLQDDRIVLRSAMAPQGPWSASTTLATAADYPGLYGGFMHPWSSGPDLYLTMSQWGPYNVYLVKVDLTRTAGVTDPNLVQDPGFERQPGHRAVMPWGCTGNCGVDDFNWAYGGSHNGYIRMNAGYNELQQTLLVDRQTDYVLRGWLRTSDNNDAGTIGVRDPDGTIVKAQKFTVDGAWTGYRIPFNSGGRRSVEIYVGINTAHGDMGVQLDDFSVVKADRS